MTGNVFNIQRFSTSDGPGIRTTLFLKGCPLSCVWCHNPESKSAKSEIFFNSSACTLCRKCEDICRQHQHNFDQNCHIYLRSNCTSCFECVSNCPAFALEICGNEMTSEDVVLEVLRDVDFYKESGGGVTLSGGEPLMQYDFSLEILKKLKESGIHTAIETSGYSNRDLSEIAKFVDLWLFDIKLFPENEHLRYTGVSNKKIFENLSFLDNIGAKTILRCPIIPGINLTTEHFNKLSTLANSLENVIALQLEPYHPLGIEKASRLGKEQGYANPEFLENEALHSYTQLLSNQTNVTVEII